MFATLRRNGTPVTFAPGHLITALLALCLLASSCGAGADEPALRSQSDLPVLGHDTSEADEVSVATTTDTIAADDTPSNGEIEPPFEPISGLPESIPIGTTYVATAIESEGTVSLWADAEAEGEPTWSLTVPTEFGGPRHFAVLDQAVASDGTAWLQVQVPVRPNGSIGWIAAEDVTLAPVTTRMEIDLSDRSVIVWDGDDIVLDTTGAIGAERTPTPTGTFYIRDQFPWDPESVYGPWVFALSSYSEVIDQINGGDAVVAIHGTRTDSVLGDAVSLGCIRLNNDVLTELASLVEPGTPVEVVP